MWHRRPSRTRDAPAQAPSTDGADRTGEAQERAILAALGDLRDTTVREVMTPRIDVVGLAIPVSAGDVARAIRESGHSRFPVYDDDLDNLIGVLFVNDLFRAGWELEAARGGSGPAARPTPLEISRRLRQPYLVPESRLVLDVMAEMRHDRRAFAVVLDEYGGVSGILTIKDLLGALVGDLRDELDPAGEPDIIRVDRRRWLVDGATAVDELRDRLGTPVPDGDYVTLGGYLFDVFGRIPDEGESIEHEGWELRVVEMDKRRIAKVVVQAPPDQARDDTPDPAQ